MNARAAAALDTDTEDEPEIDSRIQLPTEKDKIFKIELALLRPTQLAVGYEQVRAQLQVHAYKDGHAARARVCIDSGARAPVYMLPPSAKHTRPRIYTHVCVCNA